MNRDDQDYTNPEVMDDEQLRGAFFRANDFGPQQRLDEIEREIVKRWIRENGSGNF